MANICTACVPLFCGSHKRTGNTYMLFVQLCRHVLPLPPNKLKNKIKKKSSFELVRPIGYGRFATKDLESTIRNNPCQTSLLQSPAEKFGETEGSRQSTTFIVGILLTSFDLNCSPEAKPTPGVFHPLEVSDLAHYQLLASRLAKLTYKHLYTRRQFKL